VCWYDNKTKTAITGDSVQGNGTDAQGIGFYQDLDAYRASIDKLLGADVENLLLGHDYDKLGYLLLGKSATDAALRECLDITERYQQFIDAELKAGNTAPASIAQKLISEHGCGTPGYLFMSVYTVCEHIRHSAHNIEK
jgi:glyoxylase-like metal-dependent hydrolase (beta-lactamase superfamily II)